MQYEHSFSNVSTNIEVPSKKTKKNSISSPKHLGENKNGFELKMSNMVNDPATFGSPPVNQIFMDNLEKRMNIYFCK